MGGSIESGRSRIPHLILDIPVLVPATRAERPVDPGRSGVAARRRQLRHEAQRSSAYRRNEASIQGDEEGGEA